MLSLSDAIMSHPEWRIHLGSDSAGIHGVAEKLLVSLGRQVSLIAILAAKVTAVKAFRTLRRVFSDWGRFAPVETLGRAVVGNLYHLLATGSGLLDAVCRER